MWQLDNSHALFDHSLARIRIDASLPATGVVLALPIGSAVELWRIAQLASCSLSECYARDNDLVATYEPSSDFPFRSQIYWSIVEQHDALGIELAVSVQTDLLDTHPVVEVSGANITDKCDTLTIDDHSLARLSFAGTATNLVATVHPTDGAGQLNDGNHWPLFSHFLEKGVIRRARLWAALLPRDDIVMATELYRHFRDQPLPLTV